ncbi:MAG TPA: ABC transporter permease, partial [Bacteroidetes bacterium]|nr:ABC transporter permease [Bacteroidota bacterium]
RLAYLPFVSSPVILATCLLFLFIKIQLVGTILGVILAQWMFAFSFAIVFFVPFWSPQMKAIEELVYTLGGTALQAMRHVLWPMSIAALRMCFFQTFLISWVQYGITLMVGGGEIQTLPVLVYFYVNEANITFAAMASLVLMLPAFILMTVNRRHVWRD